MKFTALAIATLLPFAVLSAPTAELGGEDVDSVESVALGERAITGTVDADALKYRRCPRTSCDAVGQYPRGTRVTMECFTTTSTTTVNGDRRWARLANNYWVSLYYMNWPGTLPRC